jgi:hypothetical protein
MLQVGGYAAWVRFVVIWLTAHDQCCRDVGPSRNFLGQVRSTRKQYQPVLFRRGLRAGSLGIRSSVGAECGARISRVDLWLVVQNHVQSNYGPRFFRCI